MIGLLQRVTEASVRVEGEVVAAIEHGVLALIGVERGDSAAQAERLLARILGYRLFADEQGRMNESLSSLGAGLLLVPQFTLAANTAKGTRASFARAAEPELAVSLYTNLVAAAAQKHTIVSSGIFGADMQVSLVNDGPVTFWLQVPPEIN